MGDILIACVDGLKGFPDAIATVYPKTQVQLCIFAIAQIIVGRTHSIRSMLPGHAAQLPECIPQSFAQASNVSE